MIEQTFDEMTKCISLYDYIHTSCLNIIGNLSDISDVNEISSIFTDPDDLSGTEFFESVKNYFTSDIIRHSVHAASTDIAARDDND